MTIPIWLRSIFDSRCGYYLPVYPDDAGQALPAESLIAQYVDNHMHRESFKTLINNDPFIKVE